MWFCRPLPSLPAHLKVKVDSLTAHHQTKQERERPCPILQREGDFLSIRAIYTEQTHSSECVLMRNSGGDGIGEKTSLSEIHNEKMLTRCDCSMAKQWSIKTNLKERDRSWCETDSERIVTGSEERERQRVNLMLRDELWYCTQRRESWEITFCALLPCENLATSYFLIFT